LTRQNLQQLSPATFNLAENITRMKLVEVSTPAEQNEFIEMTVRLYKNEKNWIRPLDADIEGLFHKDTNKPFRNGLKPNAGF